MPNTPNYDESQVAGTSWKRAHHIVIENTLGGVPQMTFGEQVVYQLGDKQITEFAGQSLVVRFDAENPKHIALYIALNDLYVEARTVRDNPPSVVTPIESQPIIPDTP